MCTKQWNSWVIVNSRLKNWVKWQENDSNMGFLFMGTTKFFLLIDSIFYSIWWANQKVLWDLWFIFLVKHVSKDCSGMIRPQWFFQNTFWGSISFIFFVTLYCRIILFIVSTPIKIQKTVGLSHYLGNLPIVTLILLNILHYFSIFCTHVSSTI